MVLVGRPWERRSAHSGDWAARSRTASEREGRRLRIGPLVSGAWAAVERRCWLRVGPRSVRAPSADPHQPLSVRDLLLSLSSPADRAAADDSDRTCRRRRQALQVSPALRARVGRARDRARRSPPGRAPGNARSSCTGSLAGSVPGSCSISSIGLPRLHAPLVLVARVCVWVCGTHRIRL